MAIKYSFVPDSLSSIERGNGIEFKDLDYSAWQSTVEPQDDISFAKSFVAQIMET